MSDNKESEKPGTSKAPIAVSDDAGEDDEEMFAMDDDDSDAFLLGTSAGRGPPAASAADMTLRLEWGELRLDVRVPGDANLLALKEAVAGQLGMRVPALQAVAPGWPHLADSVLLAGLGAANGSLLRLEGGPDAALLTVYPASFQPARQQPPPKQQEPARGPVRAPASRVPHYQDVGVSQPPAAPARPRPTGPGAGEHGALAGVMDGLTARPSLAADLRDMLGLPAFPRVQATSFRTAVSAAAAARKLLLIYLHWPSHDATIPFLCGALSAPALVQYIDDNFLFWMGSLEDAQPAPGSRAYTIEEVLTQLALPRVAPLLGVVAHMAGSLSVLDIIQGAAAENVDELLVRLINVHDQQAPLLLATGSASSSHGNPEAAAAQLLAEQNLEYEQSLAQDRLKAEQAAKEAARMKELQAKQQAEEEQHRAAEAKRLQAEHELAEQQKRKREATAAAIPEEPPAGTKDSTSIAIRLPDGSRLLRRFLSAHKLQAVFDYIDASGKLPDTNSHYTLVTPLPKRVLTRSEAGSSLAELQLVPQAMLHIKFD